MNTRKKVVIIIESCTYCTHCMANSEDEYICFHPDSKEILIPLPNTIPDWCPLEDHVL